MNIKKLTTKEILNQNHKRLQHSNFHKSKVLLHNIRSMHNVGSVFRSCDAFEVQMLYLSGYTPVPPRPEISKSALGADEYVNWKYIDAPLQTIQELKDSNYSIIGVEQTNKSILLNDLTIKLDDKYLLIFGNEVNGIDQDLLEIADYCVEIPQFGIKHSFNISVAVGIVLYGLYSLFTSK